MIKVSNTDSDILLLGHAEDKRVCEAVTALTHTLLCGIETFTEDRPAHKLESGIFYLDKKDLTRDSLLLAEVFFCGLRLIAEAYAKEFTFGD